MLPLLRGTALPVVASALLLCPPDAGADPVVASCADGSVIFAGRWRDVHCDGAARMPSGQVARVASDLDRERALTREREAKRERELEASLAEALAATLPSPPPRVAP